VVWPGPFHDIPAGLFGNVSLSSLALLGAGDAGTFATSENSQCFLVSLHILALLKRDSPAILFSPLSTFQVDPDLFVKKGFLVNHLRSRQ